MKVVSIARTDQSDKDNWIKKELTALKKRTLVLLVVSLSVIGVILGYLFSGMVDGPFEGVSYAALDESGVLIEWKTKVPTKVKVEYGTSEIYLNETSMSSDYGTDHEVTISGLLPNKDHYFRLVAEDISGQKHVSGFYKTQ